VAQSAEAGALKAQQCGFESRRGHRGPPAGPRGDRFWYRLSRRGVPWDSLLFMTIVYTLTRTGRNEPMTDELPRLLGRPPRDLRRWAEDARWRWEQRAWT
jgi:hypothetical protein